MHSNTQQFHENDFSKTLLSWAFDIYKRPLSLAMRQRALPTSERDIQRYYANYLPFILEESRAIIADGLEKAEQYNQQQASSRSRRNQQAAHLSDAKPFNLTLKKDTRYPRNEGNPLAMTFRGAIPEKIEHGKSMIVLLLKTKNITPEKQFIALATENQNATELFVKIIISSEDYYSYGICFAKQRDQAAWPEWEAHYLGSVISEQRMYEACLEAVDIACVRQISSAQIPVLRVTRSTSVSSDLHQLNLSQREAIYGFTSAKKGSTLLLEGPPGTGKTTTLVNLLAETSAQKKRTLVSAHSNKGVQVLASRALEKIPEVPMILVGVESKLPEHLKPLFLNRWYDTTASYFLSFKDEIELLTQNPSANIVMTVNDLIARVSANVQLAQTALNKFNLIDSSQLSNGYRQELYKLTNNPITTGEFQRAEQAISNLESSKTKKKWKALQLSLNIMQEKWSGVVKEELEMYLLDNAAVVFATLITCGRKSMRDMDPVDCLLIDEASQSVEPATLIPIVRFQPDKVLLVGDTKQLPATVISKALDDSPENHDSKHYKWSMMWRLIEENNQPNLMLTIQYRMHPHICQWPSGQFYADRLITSPDILPVPPLTNAGIASRPYAVYQVAGQIESRDGSHSISNSSEANYVISIIEHIRRSNTQASIGIITPYSAQKQLITQKLSQKRHLLPLVDINTVDGFQGDERDIIIISFVRTHVSEFLKEFRRLNVAITRPKACLIILGAPSLVSNDIGALITDARKRNVLYSEAALKSILATGMTPATNPSNLQRTDIRTLAWQADGKSQFDYAQSFESSDKRLAYLWCRRAAENNHPQAQLILSQLYFMGSSVVKTDVQLGVSWLNKAVQHNLPEAQYELGKHFLSGEVIVKNVDSGLHWCRLAANSNLLEAIIFLAVNYQSGRDIPLNMTEAINYYRRASKLDHFDSMFKLAELLSSGTDSNKREAIKWYRKVAEKNKVAAYYPLAELLSTIGEHQAEALKWYLKAADKGNVAAQYEVSLRLKHGYHGNNIDLPSSMHYLQIAAENNHQQAQYGFAISLLQGEDVPQDSTRALFYFKAAAARGHAESQYQSGLLILQNSSHEAYPYFMLAAAQDNPSAQFESIKYQIQFGRDLGRCLHFCEKLMVQGNDDVKFILARLFESGIAGRTNNSEAHRHYSQLANHHTAAKFHQSVLEEGVAGAQDLMAIKNNYEACLDKQPKAKLYLARLLLKEEPSKAESERAIQLIKDYYINSKNVIGLTPLEKNLEQLIALKIPEELDLFVFSIDTVSSYANREIALLFKNGLGVQQNTTRAMILFKKAADANDAESQYQFALLKANESPARAYAYFLKAAKQGHVLAQSECIHTQIKSNCDLEDCLAFCENLASEENSQIQFLLARLLDTGIAGQENKARAYALYDLLAKKDNSWAKYHSARMLEEGVGVVQNLVTAKNLYLGCYQVCFEAKLKLACLLLQDLGDQGRVVVADELTGLHTSDIEVNDVDCLPRLRGQGFFPRNTYANSDLPTLTENQQVAITLLEQHYESYSNDRQRQGTLSDELEALIRKSKPALVNYSLPSINTPIAQANYFLGKIFQEGRGVEIDTVQAVKHYQKASHQFPDANYRMGYIYEAGLGVKKSWSTAKGFYQKAEQQGHELAGKRLTYSYAWFSSGTPPDDAALQAKNSSGCSVM